MAVTVYILPVGVPLASTPTTVLGIAHYICDTEAERPSAVNRLGSISYTIDTAKNWRSDGATWISVAGTGEGGAAWGDVTGTLSNQTDIQTALNAKEAANANIQAHIASAHAPSGAEVNVNADWNSGSGDSQILNKPATFTPSTHNILTAHNGFPGGTSTFMRADGTFAAPTAQVADPDIPGTGSFTVATGKWHLSPKRHQITTTQRITIQGTARLRLMN